MRNGPRLAAAALALAIVAGACGDGDGQGNAPTARADGTPTTGTATPAPPSTAPPTDSPATATDFQTLRDSLRADLDAIGVNIGSVPDDIRRQLRASCRGLEAFVDRERVAQICDAIERAIDQSDPGLIDLVIEQLDQLEPG